MQWRAGAARPFGRAMPRHGERTARRRVRAPPARRRAEVSSCGGPRQPPRRAPRLPLRPPGLALPGLQQRMLRQPVLQLPVLQLPVLQLPMLQLPMPRLPSPARRLPQRASQAQPRTRHQPLPHRPRLQLPPPRPHLPLRPCAPRWRHACAVRFAGARARPRARSPCQPDSLAGPRARRRPSGTTNNAAYRTRCRRPWSDSPRSGPAWRPARSNRDGYRA